MRVFLVDGTYELFRQFFGQPPAEDSNGMEVGAVRGVLTSVIQMIEDGATHIGVATDHVIESFRNQMYYGYKTGEGIEPLLYAQFPVLEEALTAMGVHVWPMVDLEADDALASAAEVAHKHIEVEQVVIMTPDKDLHQCVRGVEVVQYDRRNKKLIDHDGVIAKFGVEPESIPDYLGLVGDSADGFPGIAGWGAKSSSQILAKFKHLENIPHEITEWQTGIRGAATLCANLFDNWKDALLFRDLATLRIDESLLTDIDSLEWRGPTSDFARFVARLKLETLNERINNLVSKRT